MGRGLPTPCTLIRTRSDETLQKGFRVLSNMGCAESTNKADRSKPWLLHGMRPECKTRLMSFVSCDSQASIA
jgi:hypothetical protein